MFYNEDTESSDDSFEVEKIDNDPISYEGILLKYREEEIPIAIESKDTHFVNLYKPYTVELEVRYVDSDNVKVGTGRGMGYAIHEKNIITSKHLFHLKSATEKNYRAFTKGINIIHTNDKKETNIFLGNIIYEPICDKKNVMENIFSDANDYVIIEIVGGNHNIPLVYPEKISKYENCNDKYSIIIGGPTPSKGGWAKQMLKGAKLIAERKRIAQLPTVQSISNAFPSETPFTCAKIDEWKKTNDDFVVYQKSTLKSWSGAPGFVYDNYEKKLQFVSKKGKPVVILTHTGELSGQNLTYGLTAVFTNFK